MSFQVSCPRLYSSLIGFRILSLHIPAGQPSNSKRLDSLLIGAQGPALLLLPHSYWGGVSCHLPSPTQELWDSAGSIAVGTLHVVSVVVSILRRLWWQGELLSAEATMRKNCRTRALTKCGSPGLKAANLSQVLGLQMAIFTPCHHMVFLCF